MKVPHRITGAITRDVIDRAIEILGADVTIAHMRILQEVGRAHADGELIGVTEISKRLGLSMSSASRLIAQVGDFEPGGKGFITQIKHPDDRRRVVLKATEKGMQARFRHLDGVGETIEEHLDELCALRDD